MCIFLCVFLYFPVLFVPFYKRVTFAYRLKKSIASNLWEIILYGSDNMTSEEIKGFIIAGLVLFGIAVVAILISLFCILKIIKILKKENTKH